MIWYTRNNPSNRVFKAMNMNKSQIRIIPAFLVIFSILIVFRLIYSQLQPSSPSSDFFNGNSKSSVDIPSIISPHVIKKTNEYEQFCESIWMNPPSTSNQSKRECKTYLPRLIEYCNVHEPRGHEETSINHQYELVHLLLTIRHGDRSTLNYIPGAQAMNTNTSTQPFEIYKPMVLQALDDVDVFNLTYIPQNTERSESSHSSDRYNPLDKKNLFQTSDNSLFSGELTSQGYWQHINLGIYLNRIYQSFLSQIRVRQSNEKASERDGIYIRSTNYNRTIQSVVALLTHLLPKDLLTSIKESEKLKLYVFLDDDDEIMHGVGQRLSSKASVTKSASSASSNGI